METVFEENKQTCRIKKNPIANNGKLVRSELTCVGSRREKGVSESDRIPCHPPCSVRVLTGLFARMEKGFSY